MLFPGLNWPAGQEVKATHAPETRAWFGVVQPQDPDVGVLRLKPATQVLQAPVVAAQAVQFAAQF